jgi:hypothetical protein
MEVFPQPFMSHCTKIKNRFLSSNHLYGTVLFKLYHLLFALVSSPIFYRLHHPNLPQPRQSNHSININHANDSIQADTRKSDRCRFHSPIQRRQNDRRQHQRRKPVVKDRRTQRRRNNLSSLSELSTHQFCIEFGISCNSLII